MEITKTLQKYLDEAKKGETAKSKKGHSVKAKVGARGRERVEVDGDEYGPEDKYEVTTKSGKKKTRKKAAQYAKYIDMKKEKDPDSVTNPDAEKEAEEKAAKKKAKAEKKEKSSKYDEEEMTVSQYTTAKKVDDYISGRTTSYQRKHDKEVEARIKKTRADHAEETKQNKAKKKGVTRRKAGAKSKAKNPCGKNAYHENPMYGVKENKQAVKKPYLFEKNEKIIDQLVKEYVDGKSYTDVRKVLKERKVAVEDPDSGMLKFASSKTEAIHNMLENKNRKVDVSALSDSDLKDFLNTFKEEYKLQKSDSGKKYFVRK